jgi:AraC-like DNA-binding protein
MELRFTWSSILMLLGALQAVLLTLALLEKRKRKSPANRYLAVLMFLTAVRLGNAALHYAGSGPGRPASLLWTVFLILTFPPLLYLYVRALIGPSVRFRSTDALHFLPAALLAVWSEAEAFLPAAGPAVPGIDVASETAINGAWLVQTAVYIFLILRLRERHIRSAPQVLSARDKVYLDWIRNLVLGFAFIALLTLLYLLHMLAGLPLPRTPGVFLHLTIAVFVIAWGYQGLRQPEIFAVGRPEDLETRGKASAAASGLEEPLSPADESVRLILSYMNREKPFLAPDLNLFDLARSLALPPYQLSAVLNRKLGKTFFDFVNGYRVEEAKRRLLDPAGANLKILALAFECGFNSKSAFNRVFKAMTGLTPSEFQRSGR